MGDIINSIESTYQNFNSYSNKISNLLSTAENTTQASSAISVKLFESLDSQRKCRAIQNVRMQVEQMELLRPELTEKEKINLVIKYHKLHAIHDEYLNMITQEMSWEIIDFELNQLYRCKKIYELSNYSIEDFEIYSPWELFDRPSSVFESLKEAMTNLFQNKTPVKLDHIKPYVIQELLSEEKAMFLLTHQFAIPLFNDSGTCVAFVSVMKIKSFSKESQSKIAIIK